MRVKYEPREINNFHNSPAIKLHLNGETDSADGRIIYLISKRQNTRIEKHFCGIEECGCPKGASIELAEDLFAIRADWCHAWNEKDNEQ